MRDHLNHGERMANGWLSPLKKQGIIGCSDQLWNRCRGAVPPFTRYIIEGSLEVKPPTFGQMEKQRWEKSQGGEEKK